MPNEQNESKAKKFITGVASVIAKRFSQMAGAVAGLVTDLLEQGAELPKGTANQLHDAAKKLLDIEKQNQDADGVSTFVHAAATGIKGLVSALLEVVRGVDIVALDNKILDKIDKKFQEVNGDKSKFKAWLKKHPRINAYAIYYLSLTALVTGLFNGYDALDEYLEKNDMKPSKNLIKFIDDTTKNKKFIERIKDSPWLKSEEKEIKKQVKPQADNTKPNSDKKPAVDNTKQDKSDIITVTVKSGDNLEMLAARYGTTVEAIKEMNDLNSSKILVGQKLKIKKSTDENLIIITVKSGDNLDTLAKKYGTTVAQIKKMNGLKSNKINVGQKLVIRKSTDEKQVTQEQDNSKPNSDKKIVDNKKQEKPDFNQIAATLDESKFIYKNKTDGRLYINFDYIRKQVGNDKTKKLAYLKKIQENSYHTNRFREATVHCEGFEPDVYDINDGHMTQGCGMTGNYTIFPGQEVEEWMFDEYIRTTITDEYAPITDFMGRIRSYNDIWQQMDAYCLDPGQNVYKIFNYILTKTSIKGMTIDGFVSEEVAALNNFNMATQILKRLIDKKSPTGLTTDKKKIAYAFSTKQNKYKERNKKELVIYNGGKPTDSIVIGQHLPKEQRQTFSDAAAFLAANGNNGANFNNAFDRQIHAAEREALFKMFYHIINPKNDRFYLEEEDFRLIESLNAKFGDKWEKYFDEKISKSADKVQSAKTAKAKQELAKNKAQKQIILYILRNPRDAYKNRSKLLTMLKKRYAENDQNEADNAIMMAKLANTRGLGF